MSEKKNLFRETSITDPLYPGAKSGNVRFFCCANAAKTFQGVSFAVVPPAPRPRLICIGLSNTSASLWSMFVGGNALHCRLGSGLRTRLWHDPIVRECLALARMAGASCAPAVPGQMLLSDGRPGLAIFDGIGCKNQLTDVVTCDPCRKDICMRAAARAGAAAEERTFPLGEGEEPGRSGRSTR